MRPNLHREPLKLSTIPADHVWLAEGERRQIVCPDCEERRPLRRGVIWPHHTERGIKCDGAARRVEVDIDLEEWARQVTAADASVAGRRATKVTRKPKTPPPPPVSRMTPTAQTADAARRRYHLHRQRCATCQKAGRTGTHQLCTDGARLASTYVQRLEQEPRRAALEEFAGRRQIRSERRAAAEARQRTAAMWQKQEERTTARQDLTKRSGTAVEEQNNLARRLPGTTSERGRPVPLEPPHSSC